jgi:carboxymethylenebutenolidase
MSGTDITIDASDGGSFAAYLALPDGGSGPGVVVLQEIFGVNAVMRAICDGLAAKGYAAVCPDLFWRQEPGIQLTDKTDEEWARAFELFGGFDLDNGMDDIGRTVTALRKHDACTGKVGAVGFCLGGRLAFLAATRTPVDCAVGYYGVMLTEHLDEPIKAPLMLHIATEDEFAPKEAQDAVHAALDPNPKVTLYDYDGQQHAFAREGGAHYDRASADLAESRTLAFFQQHLG